MRPLLRFLFLCLSSLILHTAVVAQTFDPNYQDGKIWFKLKDNLPVSQEEALSFLANLKMRYQITETTKAFQNIQGKSPLQRTYLIRFNDIEKTKQLVEELSAQNEVEYAEQVPLDKLLLTPNDPSLSTQWHLSAIGAATAWNYFSSGSNIVVAIVDDAVETTHSDLSGNIWVNPGEIAGNGIDDDGNGYIDDINGWDLADNDNNPNPSSSGLDHGTHVAGIVSAVSNNGTGVSSMGYSCKLMCVKTTNIPVNILYGYEGIIYAANNNADVINLSWGGTSSSTTAENIINYALGKNCIIVAAAGNDNVSTPFYPANYDGVIAVAATNSSNQKAWFSNYGSWVDISAPGENIYSTTVGNSYGYKSGTSMASPLVAGLVGLMRSLNPGMPPEDVKNCLFSTAVNIDASNPDYIGLLGAGRIDAAAAMACMSVSLSNPPTADFSASNINIQAGVNVTFTDLTTYNPTSWTWSFPGGTPSSYTGQNPPAVQYNTPGTYDVTLVTSNANGTDTETKPGYITVAPSGGCHSINLPAPAGWSATNYYTGTNGADGWINGMNVYLDKEKAMYFDASSLPYSQMTKLYIAFGRGNTDDPSKVVPIHIYDGSSGSPGALIGSSSLTMSTIINDVNNGVYTDIEFNTPVNIPASKKFFVSVVLTNLEWNSSVHDTLSIISNAAGQTSPSAIWEKQSNNAWYQYTSAGSWNLNASLYIHPFLTNQAADASFTASATNICAGEIVNFDATGATTGGGFIWSLSGGTASNTNSLTPSVIYNTPGSYQAILTVAGGGCNNIAYDTVNITVNATPVISISAGDNPVCLGSSTMLTASGADTYSWAPSTGLNTTSGSSVTATPASTTTYTVVGTIGGCTNSSSLELQVANVTASHVSANVSCHGGSNGTATVTPTGGTAPYTYSWSPSGGSAATASGLAAGTYSCLITDDHGCTHTESVTISEPTLLSAGITSTDVSCNGGSNGSSTATPSGGTAPYTYAWSPSGGTAAIASGLAAGTYSCLITDDHGCTHTESVTISEPTILSAGITSTDVSCNSGSNGSATVTPAGGTAPYSYTWSPAGGSAATASGLAAGTYSCLITDDHGCTHTESVTISEPTLLSAGITSTDVSCNGGSNGSATVTPAGGTAPYSYSWSPAGGSAATASGLAAGTYSCLITDDHGCTYTESVTIYEPTILSAGITSTDVSCNSGSNGTATVTPSGGTAPYSYTWSPSGGTAVTASGLAAGTYSCLITDDHGCTHTESVTISEPTILSAGITSTDVSCNGGSNGSATVTPSGGTAPYTYSWSPAGGSAATASGLAAGTYGCLITDDHGCTHTETVTITEPGLITGTDVQNICDGDSYTFNGIAYTTDNNTATDTFVAANGCDSIVTLHLTVSSHTLAGTTSAAVNSQTNGTIAYSNSSCEMIATINSGANNLGMVTSDVFVGMVILPGEEPYLSRYYDIETSLPGGAEVTLYFSQQEIDDYNTLVGAGNPLYPQVGSNGENLQITAFHSTAGSGNGPGGYDTAAALKEVIPCTAVWNAVESRWEITFTTSQFSGFFAHTNSSGVPLPVKISHISAMNAGDHNLVEWNTLTETGMDYFEVERSRDAASFESIGNMKAKGSGSAYRFVDENPYSGFTYYRLKMWNIESTYAYSRVVKAEMHTGTFHVAAFPNPVMDKLTLRIDGVISGKGFIAISDLSGRKMFDVPVDNNTRIMEISMQDMAQGVYFLKYQDNQVTHTIKIEKQ